MLRWLDDILSCPTSYRALTVTESQWAQSPVSPPSDRRETLTKYGNHTGNHTQPARPPVNCHHISQLSSVSTWVLIIHWDFTELFRFLFPPFSAPPIYFVENWEFLQTIRPWWWRSESVMFLFICVAAGLGVVSGIYWSFSPNSDYLKSLRVWSWFTPPCSIEFTRIRLFIANWPPHYETDQACLWVWKWSLALFCFLILLPSHSPNNSPHHNKDWRLAMKYKSLFCGNKGKLAAGRQDKFQCRDQTQPNIWCIGASQPDRSAVLQRARNMKDLTRGVLCLSMSF